MDPPYFVSCDITDSYKVSWLFYKNEEQYPNENNMKMIFKVVDSLDIYSNFIKEFEDLKKE